MNAYSNKTLKELAAENYQITNVYEKYQLDFDKNAEMKLEAIAKEKEIDLKQLIVAIEEEKTKEKNKLNFKFWPLDFLAEYIVKEYHAKAEKEIQELKPILEKLEEEKSTQFPEIEKINTTFKKVSGEMAAHMKKEELMLFPFIKKMYKAKAENKKLEIPSSRFKNLIDLMLEDHDDQLEQFDKTTEWGKQYQLLAEKYWSEELTKTIEKLKELQEDLKQHVHLENDILFPKTIALAEEWTIS